MPIRRSLGITALAITSTTIFAAETKLQLSGIFSDHMVLQREIDLKIWGRTTPGDTVKLKLDDSSADGKADESGKWQIELPPQKAGGPYELTVTDSDETTTIKDILIGDVWVCSGQSNMEFQLQRVFDAEEVIINSSNNKLRLFHVPRNKALRPLDEFDPGAIWKVSSPDTTPKFSAVGYFFGQELQRELDVPIGLINSSWGGTKAEWWTPLKGLQQLPFTKADAEEMVNPEPDAKLTSDYRKASIGWQKGVMRRDPGIKKNDPIWAKSEFDDSNWKEITLPAMLEDAGLKNYDGSIWFRRDFDVTEEQSKQRATLNFCVDDGDVTFINGVQVGTVNTPNKVRNYVIMGGLLKPGKNTIAIQMWDWGKIGGICGDPASMKISFEGEGQSDSIALAGTWNYNEGLSLDNIPGRPTAPRAIRPTTLFNAMISPMIDFGIKGTIWYQGEANARSDSAPVYDELLATMITEWRNAWGLGDFPFLIVQLASYMKMEPEPTESDWAVLRESQDNVMKLVKNVAVASAIDIGEQDDIHPRNKKDVGKRLALAALAKFYSKEIEFTGPTYKSHVIESNSITITLDHASELKTKNGEPAKGFAIAGKDGRFVWANAEIKGNTVVLTSDFVKEPVAARYGWATYSRGNLYNSADLPANPFRTDKPSN